MRKSTLILFSIIALVMSCSKENISDQADIKDQMKTEKRQQLMVAPPPDLIISFYTSTVSNETTQCTDTPLPNTHCDGGDRIFISRATIQNIGTGILAAETIDLLCLDLTWGLTATTTVSHSGLVPGASIVASKQYYVGPCDCTDTPPMDEKCFVHSYDAIVDWNTMIAESREDNNTSTTFNTCDRCGPCAEPGGDRTVPMDPL